MFEITVQDTFSSGHYLRDYYGKCENPHGHNYRVLVTLIGEQLEPNGLLLDFQAPQKHPPAHHQVPGSLHDQRPRAVTPP